MLPSKYQNRFVAAVVKRSGICRATVEQVLPAVFDEIRHQLTEGDLCVPIESFGTFAVVDIPERTYHYTYKNNGQDKTIPATKRIKFAPTRNLRREVLDTHFDSTRRSFSRHPDDPPIRRRKEMMYNNRQELHRFPATSPQKGVSISLESLTTSDEKS